MRIIHLSDTHNQHHLLTDLPTADVVVHSGDFSFAGTEKEAEEFFRWFQSLPYRYKVFIAGNHDNYMYGIELGELSKDCFYLYNSGVEIEGVRLYGVPMFMEDIMSGSYDEQIKRIPSDTDIVITHQPPYGILDVAGNVHYGSKVLLEVIADIRPRYHLFGHIHDAYGMSKNKNTFFSNASIVNNHYQLANGAFVFDI